MMPLAPLPCGLVQNVSRAWSARGRGPASRRDPAVVDADADGGQAEADRGDAARRAGGAAVLDQAVRRVRLVPEVAGTPCAGACRAAPRSSSACGAARPRRATASSTDADACESMSRRMRLHVRRGRRLEAEHEREPVRLLEPAVVGPGVVEPEAVVRRAVPCSAGARASARPRSPAGTGSGSRRAARSASLQVHSAPRLTLSVLSLGWNASTASSRRLVCARAGTGMPTPDAEQDRAPGTRR